MRFSERQKGILALVCLVICWGILYLIPRYLSTSFSLFQQVYLRLFSGFALSYIFFRKDINFNKIKSLPLKEWGILTARAFGYYFLGVVLYTQSLLLTKISNVSFIQSLPMVAILGMILLKEKFTNKKLILIVLSFIGVVIISVKDYSHILTLGKGEIVAFLSSFFIGLGLVSRKWHAKILNDKEIATIILFFAAIFVFVSSAIKGEGLPLTGWYSGVVLVLFMGGLINVGIGFFVNYGFKRVEAVVAGNILALDPFLAVLLGFMFFRETPGIKELIGGILIIFSAVAMSKLINQETGIPKYKQ